MDTYHDSCSSKSEVHVIIIASVVIVVFVVLLVLGYIFLLPRIKTKIQVSRAKQEIGKDIEMQDLREK